MARLRKLLIIPAFAVLMALLSCRGPGRADPIGEDVLVTVGDSSLTLREVLLQIPAGLAPDDSAALFKGIVDNWVCDLVLADVAEKNIPDMERIDRMVEAYRNNLIVMNYLQSMDEGAYVKIPEEQVKNYYDTHREEFVLEQPLVKGVYVRVTESDPSLENLRKWMTKLDESSIDNIEKMGLRQATAYEYFCDQWIEFGQLADRIPYRFGDADEFVRGNHYFETSSSGSVHMLNLTESLPSGSEMPYEFAKQKISEILLSTHIGEVRERLKNDIYRRKISEGLLVAGLYDPLKGEMRAGRDSNTHSKTESDTTNIGQKVGTSVQAK